MHLDVVALRDFYETDPMGALVKRRLQVAAREVWPSVKGMTVAGYGFAPPILPPFALEAERTLALMPSAQGAIAWPNSGGCRTALVETYNWPVQASAVDRLILAHALEAVSRPDRLLEECWRVLAPEGRLLVIAPNRSGLWARGDGTPFGNGRPYSTRQTENLLEEHGFMASRSEGALYFPPSGRRFWRRVGVPVERLGRRLDWSRLAGVVVVEAIKRVRAPRGGVKARALSPLEAISGAVRPGRAVRPLQSAAERDGAASPGAMRSAFAA